MPKEISSVADKVAELQEAEGKGYSCSFYSEVVAVKNDNLYVLLADGWHKVNIKSIDSLP